MTVRTAWPWLSLLLAAAVICNPVGLDFIHSAFFSGEQLSRNIAQPFVYVGMAVLGALVVLEFAIRRHLMRHLQRSQ
jgi:hypothetical protein